MKWNPHPSKSVAREIIALANRFGILRSNVRHHIEAKEDIFTRSVEISFVVPANYCYIVTFPGFRSIPTPGDPSVMDFRSGDVDTTGLAQALWTVDGLPAFGISRTYLANVNQETLLSFGGGSLVTLQVTRPAGGQPTSERVQFRINGYLVPATVCGNVVPTGWPGGSLPPGCTPAFNFATPPSANSPVVNNAEIQKVYADQGRNLCYVASASPDAAHAVISIVDVTGNVIALQSTINYGALIGNHIAGLVSFGNFLFFVDAGDQITSYDVTNPAAPGPPVNLNLGAFVGNLSATVISADGKTIYIVGDGQLFIVDVTNPAAMSVIVVDLSTFAVPQPFAQQLAVDGTNVYIVDFNIPGFIGKYDCSNPLAVTQVSTVNITPVIIAESGIGCPLYFFQDRVYLTVRTSTNPVNFLSLTLEPAVAIPADNYKASGLTNTLVLAGVSGNLVALDLCVPDAPVIETAAVSPKFPAWVSVTGSNAFVGSNQTDPLVFGTQNLEIYANTA